MSTNKLWCCDQDYQEEYKCNIFANNKKIDRVRLRIRGGNEKISAGIPIVWLTKLIRLQCTAVVRSYKIAVLIVVPSMLLFFDASALTTVRSRETGIRPPAAMHGRSQERAVAQKNLDPAAWGSNHVGKPVPEFVSGNECLFCHRNDIGPAWQKNAHRMTVRPREDVPEWRDVFKGQSTLSAIAPQVEYFMGNRHRLRFLKKEGYGKFAILNTQAELGSGARVQKWIEAEKPNWDKKSSPRDARVVTPPA